MLSHGPAVNPRWIYLKGGHPEELLALEQRACTSHLVPRFVRLPCGDGPEHQAVKAEGNESYRRAPQTKKQGFCAPYRPIET